MSFITEFLKYRTVLLLKIYLKLKLYIKFVFHANNDFNDKMLSQENRKLKVIILQLILVLIFFSARSQDSMVYPYRKYDKWGMIDQKRNFIIPCIFEEVQIDYSKKGLVAVKSGTKWGMFNQKGENLTGFKYNEIRLNDISGSLIPVKIDFFWGFINPEGKTIVKPVFRRYEFLTSGYCRVMKEQEIKNLIVHKWALMDSNAKVLTAFQYDNLEYLSPGFFRARSGNNFGLMDRQGKMLCAFIYSKIAPFGSNGLAKVYIEELMGNKEVHGFINYQGKEVIPCKFYDNDPVLVFPGYDKQSGYIIVNDSSGPEILKGLMDSSGKLLIPFNYTNLEEESGYYIASKKIAEKIKYGVINSHDEIMIPFEFDRLYVSCKFSFGAIDSQEKNSNMEFRKDMSGYLMAGNYDENKNLNWGVLDIHRRVVVPLKFYQVDFSRDCIKVCLKSRNGLDSNYKTGYYNLDGMEIIPLIYDKSSGDNTYLPVRNTVVIRQNTGAGIIDLTGKMVIPPVYQDFQYRNSSWIIAKSNDLYGVIDYSNRIIIPFKYDRIKRLLNTFIVIKKDSLTEENFSGVLDYEGREVIGCRYRYIETLDGKNYTISKDGKNGD